MRLLDSCKSALEELLNLQMQEKENDPDPVVGVITVEAVEFMLRRRLTDDDWGKIEMCGGLIKHAQAWESICAGKQSLLQLVKHTRLQKTTSWMGTTDLLTPIQS